MSDSAGLQACVHRGKAEEAYSAPVDDMMRMTPTTVWLCNWPEANPDRFVDAPRWLQKRVYPGLAITPESDCVDCSARLAPASAT